MLSLNVASDDVGGLESCPIGAPYQGSAHNPLWIARLFVLEL